MKNIFFLTLGVSILVTLGGKSVFAVQPQPASLAEPPLQIDATFTPTWLPPLTPTFTASPTPTPTWVFQGPGYAVTPILLYHRIEVSSTGSRYSLTPQKFEEQIKLLRDWGYTSITTAMLVKAIVEGAPLPPRPVIITFDDGNLDNYTTAWPIMQKYGFKGVLYVVYNYIGADKYMNANQIIEMYNAGWEIGSHSMSHVDLTQVDATRQRYEIVSSRTLLQEKLGGISIMTFAYPFGAVRDGPIDYVRFAGYIAGMGATGYTAGQGSRNLWVLQRVEIQSWEDAKTFTRFLPWHGDSKYLPTDTPTATATVTRTPRAP